MKKFFVIVAIVMCALVVASTLAACVGSQGKYIVVMSVSEQTDHSFSMSYDRFDGYRIYTIKLDKVANMRIDFVTNSGKLDYVITDANGDVYMENKDVVSNGFGFEMPRGKYTVRLDANDHSGSYSFSWEYVS